MNRTAIRVSMKSEKFNAAADRAFAHRQASRNRDQSVDAGRRGKIGEQMLWSLANIQDLGGERGAFND